jgi:hypothetical protein
MRMMRVFLLAFVLSATAFANEISNLPQVKKIANGQPEDVVEFIERTVDCNHWAGEEPYDNERAEQIGKAIKNARCDGLVSEEQALELKYKRDKNVLDAIRKAKELNI